MDGRRRCSDECDGSNSEVVERAKGDLYTGIQLLMKKTSIFTINTSTTTTAIATTTTSTLHTIPPSTPAVVLDVNAMRQPDHPALTQCEFGIITRYSTGALAWGSKVLDVLLLLLLLQQRWRWILKMFLHINFKRC